MRLIRVVYGRSAYWAGLAFISAGIYALNEPFYALLVGALAVMTGVYFEVEEHGGTVFVSGLAGVLTTTGLSAIAGGIWLRQNNLHLMEMLRSELAEFAGHVKEINPNALINVDSALQQLPSVVLISLVGALALSVIGEASALRWLGSARAPRAALEKIRLIAFRVPDAFIWLTIVSIFGAFYRHGIPLAETLSINVLNVLVVLYFFQGLAVATHAFLVFQIGPFWRGLWYLVLVLQLFLLVSLVGLADFWLEFRQRLTRKPAATNKGF
jgi:Predicted membrane protein (DUF2232)